MRKQYDYYLQLAGQKERIKMTKKEVQKKLETLVTKQVDYIEGLGGISTTDYEHIEKIFRKLANGCKAYILCGVVTVYREEIK